MARPGPLDDAAVEAVVPDQRRRKGRPPDGTPRRPHAAERPRVLRRLFTHLTRSRARAGFLLAAFGVVLYSQVPDGASYDPLRQFGLIMASVAATAIFLPELSGDLWTITSDQARKLIPESRRRELAQALIGAESPDQEWNRLVYSEALLPMLDAGRAPWLNLRNLNYAARVHLERGVPVPGLGPTSHYIDIVQYSERVLPPAPGDGSYWISLARSQRALEAEFLHQGCIARELVELGDLRGRAWFDAVSELCRAGVVIDGAVQEVDQDPYDGAMPDVVRFRFRPELDSPLDRVPVRVGFDFPISADVTTFPVILKYYCGGATVVTLRLYHGDEAPTLTCHAFLGRRLGEYRDRNQVALREGPGWKEMSFGTGRDSMMWPGSGVLFTWSGDRA